MVAISQQQNNKLKNVNSILTYEDVVAWLDSSWSNAEPVNNDRVKNLDKILGNPYATLVSGGITLFILWLILNWMYKKKIFIKI